MPQWKMTKPSPPKPVLNIFAGPNGSGKSTIIAGFLADSEDLGVLVNADEIAKQIGQRKSESTLSEATQWNAADAAEIMRWYLVSQEVTLTIETVMSDHTRWIPFFREAKQRGYHLNLYFVTTDDPQTNVNRVLNRVAKGGHPVPSGKVVSRYRRVMDESLPQVLALVDEAVLFDNSQSTGARAVLKKSSGVLESLTDMRLPAWAAKLL